MDLGGERPRGHLTKFPRVHVLGEPALELGNLVWNLDEVLSIRGEVGPASEVQQRRVHNEKTQKDLSPQI